MKLFSSLQQDIEQDMLPGLHRRMTADNIRRGKILAVSSIISMAFYALLISICATLRISNQYALFTYAGVYISQAVLNAVYLFATKGLKSVDHLSQRELRRINRGILAYVVLFMIWGSIVSLLTQQMYGQLTIFMISTMACSIGLLFDDKKMLFALSIPSLLFIAGIPYFQHSVNVLLGNLVNLVFFLAACWLMSRVAFRKYCSDYVTCEMLARANSMLERQMRQNELIYSQLEQANTRLRMLCQFDELTGAANRRCFYSYVDRMLNAGQQGMRLSVIMLDIDHFKQYNDQFGHAAGDQLLVKTADLLRAEVRGAQDTFVRWGGDEFLFATLSAGGDARDIARIAQNIRGGVVNLAHTSLQHHAQHVSISGGICTQPISCREDVDRCIELADQALYQAKASGRNRMETAQGKSA